MYLYEIGASNLGSYSPIHATLGSTAGEILARMRQAQFRFEDEILVDEEVPHALARATGGVVSANTGYLRVSASSPGHSILLLPLQFSHCLVVRSAGGAAASTPRLIRANLLATAALFEGVLDARISFDFGFGRASRCRLQDVEDYHRLGLAGFAK